MRKRKKISRWFKNRKKSIMESKCFDTSVSLGKTFCNVALALFCSILPTLIVMLWRYFDHVSKNLSPLDNSLPFPASLGIEVGEVLIYILSFSGPIIASMFYFGRSKTKPGFFSVVTWIIFIVAVVLFCGTKFDAIETSNELWFWIKIMFALILIVWFAHMYVCDRIPNQDDIDNKNKKDYSVKEQKFNELVIKERGQK